MSWKWQNGETGQGCRPLEYLRPQLQLMREQQYHLQQLQQQQQQQQQQRLQLQQLEQQARRQYEFARGWTSPWLDLRYSRSDDTRFTQANEYDVRMQRARTPGPAFNRQHPYRRDSRSRSVEPNHRFGRYRSRSVGPEMRFRRNDHVNSRRDMNSGIDKVSVRHDRLKEPVNASVWINRGEGAHREISRNASTQSQAANRPRPEDKGPGRVRTRENPAQRLRTTSEGGSVTRITRTITNMMEGVLSKPKSADGERKEQSGSRNWGTSQSADAPKGHCVSSGSIKRTVVNAAAGRGQPHKVGERNHRLRSFREEEEVEEDRQQMNGYEEDGNEEVVSGVVDTADSKLEEGLPDGRSGTDRQARSRAREQQAAGQVPDYDAGVAAGMSALKWTVGLRCRLCHQFFLALEQAEQHCRTVEHYNNYVNRISELQQALNADPMDGVKALELERLLEDEPPPETPPPATSYLSDK